MGEKYSRRDSSRDWRWIQDKGACKGQNVETGYDRRSVLAYTTVGWVYLNDFQCGLKEKFGTTEELVGNGLQIKRNP